MKNFTTQGYRLLLVIILSLAGTIAARAQYSGVNFETGGLYTALAKDAANNLYVTRVAPATSGATYEVEKYTNGSGTPAVIYTGLTHEAEDFPWGLAVTSTGNVFISTDFTSSSGSIIELVNSGGTYTPAAYQTGRFFTALAVDAGDNLYATEYDVSHLTYAVVKYPANSASGTAGTNLYDNLKSGAGYAYPTGLTIASNGDVYVADAFSNDPNITDGGHVYKLTAASSYTVSTISTGNYSSALALDGSGNLYSNENRGSGYSLIRYANAAGAGTPVFSPLHTNGIYYPWGIVVYSLANIYVADGDDGSTGGAIIKLSPTPPTVTTNAATLITSTGATLNGQVNDNGNTTTVNFIYGTSSTLSGAVTKQATTGGTINAGSGNTAVALTATGLASSTTYYYAASATNSGGTIQGVILSFLTTPSLSYASPKSFNSGVQISPQNPVSSSVPSPAYGSPVVVGSGFSTPFGVAADVAGNVYVADYGNEQIKEIPAGGGAPVTLLSGFTTGIGVAVDASGNIYVADAGNTTINEYPAGTTTPVALATGFGAPYGIAVDAKGNVYVADYNNSAVDKIPAGGGTPVAIGSGFVNPTGVAVDAAGNVFVADYGNGLVKEILVNGGATIAVGSGFNKPVGVTIDPAGNLFVADYGASAVYEIPAGLSTPIAVGSGYTNPTGVAVDGFGKLAVANYLASNIEQLTPVGGYYLSNPLPVGLVFNGTTGVITGAPATLTAAANYTVTAYNTSGGTSAVINIKVVPNANLSALKMSSGAFSPGFASGTTSYTDAVGNPISSVTVTPTTADAAATVTVNGTTVTSGTPSGAINLNVGDNTINVVVTAQDGATTKTYTVTVTRAPSNNDNLSALTLSKGTLSPAFDSGTTAYTDAVGNLVTSITVTPTTADPGATVKVNGTVVTSGTASHSINLAVGTKKITITVVAQDGKTTNNYIVNVTRAASTNDQLSGLKMSKGAFSPGFSSGNTSYTDAVGNPITSVTVTPTTADSTATVQVNGTTVPSGTASGAINLNVGPNTVNVVVTAQDGVSTRTYTVTVTRAPSNNDNLSSLQISKGSFSPTFDSGTTSYTETVANTVDSIAVTPTASDPDATIKVNGFPVSSGTASGPMKLAVGPNAINVVVTASDGTTTKTYTVTVTRPPTANDNLSALKLSKGVFSPTFASGTTSYTDAVGNPITSVTVTPTASDPDALIQVNGTTVPSGTASGSINLVVGSNTINVVVTASNNVNTKTYTVIVTRPPSNNDNLSSLQMSKGTLSPTFDSGTTGYTETVANSVTSIAVTPIASDPDATIQVNGTTVASGTASGAINLAVGPNTINVMVTASDGTTTQTYTVTVTRAASANDNLSSLKITKGTLSPSFSASTTSYSDNVDNTVTSTTVIPTASDPDAVIQVNGTTVASGKASGAINLAVGPNTINVMVTASNNVSTKTYTITITRASGGSDSYDPGISVNNPAARPSFDEDIIVVHQGVSPNGDGVNDFLMIDGIQAYPDNKLSIMNRNGQLVYEASGYDNSSKVFDGHSNKNGQMQLPGTYFYQLDYTVSGIVKHKTGFIVLKY